MDENHLRNSQCDYWYSNKYKKYETSNIEHHIYLFNDSASYTSDTKLEKIQTKCFGLDWKKWNDAHEAAKTKRKEKEKNRLKNRLVQNEQ